MSSSRLVSGIKVPAQRTVERRDDLIPGDALCPLFLALLLPSRCAYIRSCKLNIAPISSRMMNRLKENKATIIAFLLSFFSFLHTNLAPQNFPKIPSFRSIFLLPSWRKVKRRRPLSLSLPFLEKGLKEWKRGGCGQNLFRSKGEGSWNFRGFLLLREREKEKGRERGNWRLPTTTTAAASSRGWEHPGQRWMGLYRKPGFFFLLRDPPANGSHLSDRVDLGSGAWKIQGEEISNFWSFHLISCSLNFEKNFKLSSSPTPPLRSFQKRYIFIYIFSKKKIKRSSRFDHPLTRASVERIVIDPTCFLDPTDASCFQNYGGSGEKLIEEFLPRAQDHSKNLKIHFHFSLSLDRITAPSSRQQNSPSSESWNLLSPLSTGTMTRNKVRQTRGKRRR